MAQLTCFRSRGPLRTYVLGGPHGERDCYFCAELAMESCVHVGLLPRDTTRPCATYPQDMFFDKSYNYFLNNHFTLADGWQPPARWLGKGPAAAESTPSRLPPVPRAVLGPPVSLEIIPAEARTQK
jgi:hypothetical protein